MISWVMISLKAQTSVDTLPSTSSSCLFTVSACEGDSIELTPNDLVKHTHLNWYFGSISPSNIITGTNSTFNVSSLSGSKIRVIKPGGTYILTAEYNTPLECSAKNDTVVINFAPKPVVSVTATNATVCTGSSTVLTAFVTNSSGIWNYQWQSSLDGINFNDISGETGVSFTTPILSTTMFYRVSASQDSNSCGEITSATQAVSVTPNPVADAGVDISQCSSTFTMKANTPSVGSGFWTIIDGSAIINNPNSPTTTVNVISKTVILRWTIRVNAACEDFDDVLLNLADQLTITTNPVDLNECIGGNLALNITTSGGTGTQSYKWQSSTDNINWTDISNQSNSTITPPSDFSNTLYYRVRIYPIGLGCTVATSTSAKVQIFKNPSIIIKTDNTAICSGTSTQLIASISDGFGTISYQWQSSQDGISFNDISGANSAIYDTPILTATTYYRLQINQSGSGCGTVTSNTTIITVVPFINITAQPIPVKQCVGGALPLIVTTQSTISTLSFQWQSSPDNNIWVDISGANNSSYTPSSTVAGISYYRVIIRNTIGNCSDVISNATLVEIIPKPIVTVSALNQVVCNGAKGIVLNATITGGVDCTIQWQNSTNAGAIWNDLMGEKNNTLSISNLSQTTKYRVSFICNGNGCCN
jgi:Ig-like domain CHU_C associated